MKDYKLIAPLLFVYRLIKKNISIFLGTYFPRIQAKRVYRNILHRDLNLIEPRDLNEKINWLKFYGNTSEWTLLADKYRVREYVISKGLEEILPKLYGVWNSVNDINLDQLPKKFVLKTNHGCGSIIIVPDKDKFNFEEAKVKLQTWLRNKFGALTAEPHYLKIKPCVIAEELLENTCSVSSSIVDYKIWCFDGTPYCIQVCANRQIGVKTEMSFYTLDWEIISDINSGSHKNDYVIVPKPASLNLMLNYSSILSKGHPQVRIDFYDVDGKVFFGEMTFTSLGGYMDYISCDYLQKMGALTKL